MKSFTVIVLLICLSSVAYSKLVCGTNYCKENPCTAPVASSSCRSPSEYRPQHVGRCGCCPACITLLEKGAACKHYSKDLGETPTSVCREPLECQRGECVKVIK